MPGPQEERRHGGGGRGEDRADEEGGVIPAVESVDEFPPGAESYLGMTAAAPQAIAFAIRGPITHAARRALRPCLRPADDECRLDTTLCNIAGIEPDAVTVDALARLQLAAPPPRLLGAPPERIGLSSARSSRSMGLEDVLAD